MTALVTKERKTLEIVSSFLRLCQVSEKFVQKVLSVFPYNKNKTTAVGGKGVNKLFISYNNNETKALNFLPVLRHLTFLSSRRKFFKFL